MNRICAFFIVSSSSEECIISKFYDCTSPRNMVTAFIKQMADQKKNGPVSILNNRHYYHIERQGLLFVAVSACEISLVYAVELLTNFYGLCKDFCGIISESCLKSNYTLISELLNDFMDSGIEQLSTTERLKPYIQSEPLLPKSSLISEPNAHGLFGLEYKTVPSSASNQPVIRTLPEKEVRKNEIFVDVIERLNVSMKNDTVTHAELQGHINIKSFLMGAPLIKMGFNEDLHIGKHKRLQSYDKVTYLDMISFHSSVTTTDFSTHKVVAISPPDGEFTAARYSLTGEIPGGVPITVKSTVQQITGSRDVLLSVEAHCRIPSHLAAINVTVSIPVPSDTVSMSKTLRSTDNETAEFLSTDKVVDWKIKKLVGKGTTIAKFTLGMPNIQPRMSEFGPVALRFELSGYACSRLQINFLRVFDKENSYVPCRWIRYLTASDSYVVHLPECQTDA